jgi:hypothetical protein
MPSAKTAIAGYLRNHASDEFLNAVETLAPSVLDSCLAIVPDPDDDSEAAAQLAVRIASVQPQSLLSPARVVILQKALLEADADSGWIGFLEIEELEALLPALWARTTSTPDAGRVSRIYDWATADLSSSDHVEAAIETLKSHRALVERCVAVDAQTRNAYEYSLTRLEEERGEIAEAEEARSDAYMDEWKERRWEEKYELENGPFADVDE